jgi:beta-lactamase regulating signal transducer with metallopeptidase domain
MKTLTPLDPLGLTLLHSLWQGGAIAAVLAVILSTLMRNASPTARQIAAWLALAGIILAATVTLHRQSASSAHHPPSSEMAASWIEVSTQPAAKVQQTPARAYFSWTGAIGLTWLLGSVVAFGRLGAGWWRLRRLSGAARPVTEVAVVRLFEKTRARLGICERIGLRVCENGAIDSPSIAGFLWPVVLIPAGLLAGAPTAHVQAIFAHELAHFRRWDYVTNLLLGLVESVFFFHPVVRWIGQTIRIEREHACDDVAASRVCGAADYVRALAWLETRRIAGSASIPALAVVTDRGSTLRRIERMLSGTGPFPIKQGLISDHTLLPWIPGALAAVVVWLSCGGDVRGQFASAPEWRLEGENWAAQLTERIAEVAQAKAQLDGPAKVFRDERATMFSPGILLEKGGRLIRLQDENPRLFAEFPNDWILRHDLNPLDGDLPIRDGDRDGFTNEEEFLAETDPKVVGDHPPYTDKLRFAERKAQHYRLRYEARIDESQVQFRRLPSAVWKQEVFILRKGDESPDGQFKVGDWGGRELSIVYMPTGKVEWLTKGLDLVLPTWFAEFRLDLDGEEPFIVKEGETFALSREPGRRYRLVSVEADRATIAPEGQAERTVEILRAVR